MSRYFSVLPYVKISLSVIGGAIALYASYVSILAFASIDIPGIQIDLSCGSQEQPWLATAHEYEVFERVMEFSERHNGALVFLDFNIEAQDGSGFCPREELRLDEVFDLEGDDTVNLPYATFEAARPEWRSHFPTTDVRSSGFRFSLVPFHAVVGSIFVPHEFQIASNYPYTTSRYGSFINFQGVFRVEYYSGTGPHGVHSVFQPIQSDRNFDQVLRCYRDPPSSALARLTQRCLNMERFGV